MRDTTGPGVTSFDGQPGHAQSVQGQPVQGTAGESPVPGESETRPTSGRREVRVVPKPWGHETIWAHTDRYVGKILHIRAGEALSVQYHERKDETVYLLRGEMIYRVEQDGELRDMQLREGESFRIVPGTVHQMEAVTDCDVLEASTPELDDVVRLTDRYGREGTSTP
ncbi:MAG TPA: cupin domain-containing protein [Gemmatimonadaceae bacterium]|nr:cupin domain-containing protein [Gemmatimonadaceae bacterium]